jgi:pimeloyl-ACP methyl ester carboxylesterase
MAPATKLHCSASHEENHLRPPVLLIHGAGGHHLYWPPQIRRLHNQRIFAMDLPGHGWSEGIGHDCVEDYVEDVLELMTELRFNAAVLVGHSMGGAIALEAALRSPGCVLGIGLVGSGARLRVDPVVLRNAAQEATFHIAINRIAERSFAACADGRLKELAVQRMAEMRPSVLHGDLTACDAFDAFGRLSEIGCPALILCGAEDRITPPSCSEYLHDNIMGSSLQILPNAGHMVMLEQPDQTGEALGRFLDSISYKPGQ